MCNHEVIRSQRDCGWFTREPDLADMLRDPMMQALMAADHVDDRDLDALLADARHSLRIDRVN